MANESAHPARIALAHDWLCGYRGGEAVLEAIAAVIADAPEWSAKRVYTMFDDREPMAANVDALPRRVSTINALRRGRRWALPAYPLAVAQLSRMLARDHKREPIDLLVSTSSAAIKGLKPPSRVPHICYCHSPARYVWTQRAMYAGGLRGAALRAIGPAYRVWDRRTASRVTRFVANSAHIARDIERCFGRGADVIHPPARTDFFTPEPSIAREGFLLCVGAMEPYKRTDLAIESARRADRELVLVGDGSCFDDLHARHESDRVRFLGRVCDQTLRDLYRRASALLFPQVEDFGIVAVEAQACGLPVIARAAGGALDSVVDGKTGVLVESEDPCDFARAIGALEPDPTACRANAERFSGSVFAERIGALIRDVLTRA